MPKNKAIFIALTYVYGIGRTSAFNICAKASVNPVVKVCDLNDEQVDRILGVVGSSFVVEGELRKVVALNIKELISLGCYRGIRHRKNLPVRGQKTHSNARTRKGRARVAVAGKKKA